MARIALSAAGGDGEAVHAVAVDSELLQVVEVQPHAILVARHLTRIGAPPDDGRHHDRVASGAGRRRHDHAVADAEPRVRGEPLVDRDRADRRPAADCGLRPCRRHAGPGSLQRSDDGRDHRKH
jgi:hypothetical protein